MVFYPESIARCRRNRREFSLRVLVRTRSIMRKENIDLFKYGTFPYGEWFEGSNKAAGKLPVATTLSRHCRYSTPSSPRDGGVE